MMIILIILHDQCYHTTYNNEINLHMDEIFANLTLCLTQNYCGQEKYPIINIL